MPKKSDKDEKVDTPYRCEVIIRKDEGEEGVQCPADATQVIQIVDPDDPAKLRIIGVVIVCDRHGEKFDTGKTMLLRDKSGGLSLAQSSDTIPSGESPPTP